LNHEGPFLEALEHLRSMLSFLSSLKSDIVTELELVAGGRWGITVLAPNNLVQLIGIHERLAQLEIHPFFQVRGAGERNRQK